MDWIYCNRCSYADQLNDGSYYCTYRRYFESEYSGCYDGKYGYPLLADCDTESLYEDWLSMHRYKAKNKPTDPPSLWQIMLNWFSNMRKRPTDTKEEQ